MSDRPVHAVVVAYQAAGALEACLASLQQQVEVTVVDNSSSREVAAVAASFASATLTPAANPRLRPPSM